MNWGPEFLASNVRLHLGGILSVRPLWKQVVSTQVGRPAVPIRIVQCGVLEVGLTHCAEVLVHLKHERMQAPNVLPT